MPSTARRGRGAPFGIAWRLSGIDPDLHRPRVRFETFGASQSHNCRRKTAESRLVKMLDRDDLDVVGHRETAAYSRRAAGGQDMIRTGGVVAGCLRAIGAYENAASVSDL